jgi:hypothetical protein
VKLFHKHEYRVICANAVKVYFAGMSIANRTDTKVDLLCSGCGNVKTKTFMGQELSPGHIQEIAEIKGWDIDPDVFA